MSSAQSFTATAHITIHSTPARVWQALVTPEMIQQYMFGAQVETTWKKGAELRYKGEWEGQPYEDKGTILDIQPEKLLQATYFSSMSGKEDRPENYQVVSYELEGDGRGPTTLTVTQTNEFSQEAADRSAHNWEGVLTTLKELLEK